MGVEANTNKTEYVYPLVEHKAGHTHFNAWLLQINVVYYMNRLYYIDITLTQPGE